MGRKKSINDKENDDEKNGVSSAVPCTCRGFVSPGGMGCPSLPIHEN